MPLFLGGDPFISSWIRNYNPYVRALLCPSCARLMYRARRFATMLFVPSLQKELSKGGCRRQMHTTPSVGPVTK